MGKLSLKEGLLQNPSVPALMEDSGLIKQARYGGNRQCQLLGRKLRCSQNFEGIRQDMVHNQEVMAV